MVNVTRHVALPPHPVVKHTNLFYLGIDDSLAISSLIYYHYPYVVGVDVCSVEHCDFLRRHHITL